MKGRVLTFLCFGRARRKPASSDFKSQNLGFVSACRLFSRYPCCSSFEHLLIISCASRNPGPSSEETTRRRTESSMGNAGQSLFRFKPVPFEAVPFELSRSNGGCNAQIACYRDRVARACFRGTAGSQPCRGGGIGQRALEIFQPGRVGPPGPHRSAGALRDHGIFVVVGEKPTALMPANSD
jgi:hypothetical protein